MTRAWEEWELDAVRRHYRKHGTRWDGWSAILPGRTPAAIGHKAKDLGVKSERYWTQEEDNVLLAHYENKNKNWDGWRKLLPHKTRRQMTNRAQQLGLKSPRGGRKGGWTDAERARLLLAVRSVSEETGHTVIGCIKELTNMRMRAQEKRRHEKQAEQL